MYKIIIRDLTGFRQEFDLNEKVSVVGRGDKVHIKLDSTKISRQHFRIIFKGLKVYIEDLNSANGVFLNDEKLEKVSTISENDIIQFGDYYAQLNNTNKIRKVFKIDGFVEDEMDSIREKNISPFYKIVSQDKRYPGLVFELKPGVTTIGRTRASDIIIPDNTLSKKHLKLEYKSEKLYLEDLGSINGTQINGRKLRGVKEVFDKDNITIGDVEFIIESNIRTERKKDYKKIIIIVSVVFGLLLLGLMLKPSKKEKVVINPRNVVREGCEGLSDSDCDIKLQEREIHRLLGESMKYGKIKNWDGAIKICEKILDKDPMNENAKKYKIKYMNEKKNKILYDKILLEKNSDLEAALKTSEKIPKNSSYREGALLLRTQIKDDLIRTYYGKVKSLYKANRFRDSYETLRNLFKITSFHEGGKKYKLLIERIYNRCKKNVCTSTKYSRIGSITKFVIDIKNFKNVKKDEDIKEKLKKLYNDKILYTAIDYYISGDIDYAINYLNRVGKSKKVYDEAQALAKKLQNIKYLYSTGLGFYSDKRLEKAREEWNKLLTQDKILLPFRKVKSNYRNKIISSLSERFYEKGNAEFKARRMKRAYKYYKEALSFNPNNIQVLNKLSRLQTGAEKRWRQSLIYERKGDKRAFDLWETIIGVTDRNTDVHQKALKKLSER